MSAALRLTTSADLAEQWGMTEKELKRRVHRYGWPVVRLSRTDWRFTDQQVEQIVAMQSRATTPKKKAASSNKTGQSKRSAARSS